MTFIPIKTAPDGHEIHVNPATVAKIIAEKPVEVPDQPPRHTTTLIFTGGVKKETVEGRAREIAKDFDRGLR